MHSVCLIIMLFSVPPEWEDEETLMLREKWDRGTMGAADWDTATIGALRMQCVWRGFMDRRRMFYRREYVQWGSVQMEHLRRALSALTYAIMASYIAFTTYLCLIYGVKFSPTQAALWITSTGWAMLIELFVQEPLLILSSTVVFSGQMVGHIGDAITELAGM